MILLIRFIEIKIYVFENFERLRQRTFDFCKLTNISQ